MPTHSYPHKEMAPCGEKKIEQKYKNVSNGSEILNRQRALAGLD